MCEDRRCVFDVALWARKGGCGWILLWIARIYGHKKLLVPVTELTAALICGGCWCVRTCCCCTADYRPLCMLLLYVIASMLLKPLEQYTRYLVSKVGYNRPDCVPFTMTRMKIHTHIRAPSVVFTKQRPQCAAAVFRGGVMHVQQQKTRYRQTVFSIFMEFRNK